jgi:uncharacterized protein YceK
VNVIRFPFWFLLAAFCSGCGTISNHPGDSGARHPYGGVANTYSMATSREGMLYGGPLWFLDMPFSFVGDTLLLPSDAYRTHQVKEYQESLKRNPPDPDPLAGWKSNFGTQPDKVIEEDYQDYIQKLPPDQRKALIINHYMVQLFEDGTGNHAMQIKIVINGITPWHNGTLWKHVLIYDKSNTRMKALKYENGHLRS